METNSLTDLGKLMLIIGFFMPVPVFTILLYTKFYFSPSIVLPNQLRIFAS